MRDLGNTVVVVEHDLEVIRQSDHVLDLGPGAGESGGQILFAGTLAELTSRNGKSQTPTARHIASYHVPPVPSRSRSPHSWVRIKGARGNNLKNLDVKIPLGVLCCVTGVSGSGKTTLVRDTLTAAYRRQRQLAPIEAAPFDVIEGMDQIKELHWVDQTPLARSSRSNPATYVKAFDAIRGVIGSSREARALGLNERHFSFNVDLGRCRTCKGTGFQTIDMHFMADIEVICETCDGRRFKEKVLGMRWNGKNIHDILNLTADDAAQFFAGEKKIVRSLKPILDVGLGYLRLGQNTTTLSGGEAQRLKLAGHLAKMREGEGLLFIFDEPTTGLHAEDVVRLLGVFHQLVDRGCSLIVVEHNLDLIASADYVIDLGPDGGDKGGDIVAQGTIKDLIGSRESLTGRHMTERFPSARD
ncbi:ATP-binding cassette domain-containing protein [Candidatus Sumerlaeota bacterium]|nr:ATP-binding cassette domain-containing protein [Candidatus Sumerlaeota bacterium]